MADIDQEKFFVLGLELSEDDAQRLNKLFNNVCLGLAAASAAGISILALKDLNKPMASAPSKNMQLVMLLIGAGVGFVIGEAECTPVRLKIQQYLSTQTDTASAIGNLSLSQRKEFQDEARRILALERKLMDLDQGDRQPEYMT